MDIEGDVQTSSNVAGAGRLFRHRVRIRYEPATGELSLDDEYLASLKERSRAVARASIVGETGGAASDNGIVAW